MRRRRSTRFLFERFMVSMVLAFLGFIVWDRNNVASFGNCVVAFCIGYHIASMVAGFYELRNKTSRLTHG